MYDNIERELKLLINENIYNELLHSYDFHNPITQTNTYFDTENQDVKTTWRSPDSNNSK